MPRRWTVVLVLFAMAASLSAALLEYRTNRIVTHLDGTETRSIKADPIITTHEEIADLICFKRLPCKDKAIYTVHGIFPRARISRAEGIVGGTIIPYLLLCAAGYLTLQAFVGRMRVIAAGLLSVVGLGFLMLPAVAIYMALAVYDIALATLLQSRLELPFTLMFIALGSTFLTAGIWLGIRAYRARAAS